MRIGSHSDLLFCRYVGNDIGKIKCKDDLKVFQCVSTKFFSFMGCGSNGMGCRLKFLLIIF